MRAASSPWALSADDRVSADLQLPKSDGRLCYFAVPTRLIGWYRETLFPIVEETGLVPMTARDVYSAPGSVGAKIDALIERAAVVVAEIGHDGDGAYEANLALSRKGPRRTLVIASEEPRDRKVLVTEGRLHQRDMDVLWRPDLEADPRQFVEGFADWLARIPSDRMESADEPRRLLAIGEYGPALISAVSLLEFTLTRTLKGRAPGQARVPLRGLLQTAHNMGVIQSGAEREQLEQAITRRNEVVHRVKTVPAQVARSDVDLILRTVDRANSW